MYYLRKEPLEQLIEAIEKTDGTIIPERTHMVHDRAIYKHRRFSRFYRNPHPNCDRELVLYKVKTIQRILALRKEMFEYCGEWFDVYDENGKVDISALVEV